MFESVWAFIEKVLGKSDDVTQCERCDQWSPAGCKLGLKIEYEGKKCPGYSDGVVVDDY